MAGQLTNDVLLNLPHRQFTVTMPRALRPFFRRDQRPFSHASRPTYSLISELYNESVGRLVLTGMVIANQTFAGWNPYVRCTLY